MDTSVAVSIKDVFWGIPEESGHSILIVSLYGEAK
jgi:hypothetical protein